MLDLDTRETRELLDTPGATLMYPSVSPDGGWVFFVEAASAHAEAPLATA